VEFQRFEGTRVRLFTLSSLFQRAVAFVKKNPYILLSFLGIPILFCATRWGIGTEADSTYYIAGARRIASGAGYNTITPTGYLERITWFPPFYSLVLSCSRWVQMDPLAGARYLNIFLFSLNALIFGKLLKDATRSSIILPMVGVLLFLFSSDVFFAHTMVYSEPLFLSFMLLAMYFLSKAIQRHDLTGILLTSAFMALSTLTRYAGVAIIAAGIATLVFQRPTQPKKWPRLLVLALYSIAPFALFSLRNKLLAGDATNRSFAFILRLHQIK